MLTNGRLAGHHATPNNSKASAQLSHRLSSASSFCRHAFLKATISLRMERGWADTAHTTELLHCFCSVVRIGRSGRRCADTAHATELAEREGAGIANRQDRPVLKSPIEFPQNPAAGF